MYTYKFAWPLAKGVSRPDINHPHLIHKSTNRFFILSLLDLSSIPRAREGALGGPWVPKSVRRPSDQWSQTSFGGLLATLLGSFSLLLAILGLHLLFLSLLSLPCYDLWTDFLAASSYKSCFSVERTVDFEVLVFFS